MGRSSTTVVERSSRIRLHRRVVLRCAAIAVVLALVITGGYFFTRYQQLLSQSNTQSTEQPSETQAVLRSLSQIILITSDQEPTVARVENVDALKKSNPSFYQNVEKGDYLIFYPDRGIIYRKNQNKIINIAPVSPNN